MRTSSGARPKPTGMQSYRRRMVQEGWSEQDVREALRQAPSTDRPRLRNTSAERIVRRAYQDVLNREPDPGGLNTYTRAIIENGWTIRMSPGAAAQ